MAYGLDTTTSEKLWRLQVSAALGGWTFDATTGSATVTKTIPLTVATLPAPAVAGAGAKAIVSDANATTFNSIVAGGGANVVPVFCTVADWRIG